ncbi:hypothetical protein BaRGS_00033747, partial [Batillaria attramentaria]
MIWKTPGKVWPGMRERRKSTGMCEASQDCDHISLDDLHQCDSDCPLLTSGTCPNALGQASGNQGGRGSLGETKLRVKSRK